jgi:hypothetical protein
MGLRSGPRKTEQGHTVAVIPSIKNKEKSREMDQNEALGEGKYLPE